MTKARARPGRGQAVPTTLRVTHCPMNIAGIPWANIQALRRKGVDARLVVFERPPDNRSPRREPGRSKARPAPTSTDGSCEPDISGWAAVDILDPELKLELRPSRCEACAGVPK